MPTPPPPPNPPRSGRRTGPNALPTPKQLDGYRRELRMKANEGDTVAIGLVILCETLRQQQSALSCAEEEDCQ